MGEMADYYSEQEEHRFYKENSAAAIMSYQEWLIHEDQLERERKIEEAQEYLRKLLKTLREGEQWTTAKGDLLSIDQIKPRHARNIINWLRQRAKILHDWACLEFMALPQPNGEQAGYMIEAEFDYLNQQDPIEWLMSQPLVVNLSKKTRPLKQRRRCRQRQGIVRSQSTSVNRLPKGDKMDPKLAEKVRRSARKLNKADEALRTDKETPVEELVATYQKALKSHRKNLDKLDQVESA